MLRSVLRLPPIYQLLAFLHARRVVVQGWSMYPTLAPGERVLFDTLAYRRERPRRGDVVLARHPERPSMKLVKRVAAVPGDRIRTQDDARRVEEAGGQAPSLCEAVADALAQVRTLGEDEYFLLGDAPEVSTDARHFGAVNGPDILGRAWLVYWPAGRLRRVGGPPS